jgi:beta-lactam-binding protein with PASTA domain
MNFGRFIISKTFFINLGIIFGLSIVLLFIVIKGLNSYTGLGEYILVPQLDNYDSDSLVANSDPNFLQYVLIDSIYDANGRPGGVSSQHPKAGAKVKKSRIIYLTVVTKGNEYVRMPNLVDLSIRRAIDVINESRLKLNQLIFVDNFARNAVLAQLIRQDTIIPDSLILIGSPINLVIGDGHNPTGVHPPFLIGKTSEEAKELILKSSLNFGGADTLNGNSRKDLKVFMQYPYFDQKEVILLGDEMRISLRSSIDFDFDSLIYSMLHDTTKVDSHFVDSLLFNEVFQEF